MQPVASVSYVSIIIPPEIIIIIIIDIDPTKTDRSRGAQLNEADFRRDYHVRDEDRRRSFLPLSPARNCVAGDRRKSWKSRRYVVEVKSVFGLCRISSLGNREQEREPGTVTDLS